MLGFWSVPIIGSCGVGTTFCVRTLFDGGTSCAKAGAIMAKETIKSLALASAVLLLRARRCTLPRVWSERFSFSVPIDDVSIVET